MFGMGMQEILIVLAVALIFIGPKRLPEIARTLGKGLGELRRASNDLKGQIDLDSMVVDQEENAHEASYPPQKDLDDSRAQTYPDDISFPPTSHESLSPAHEQEKETFPEKTKD